ncbi:MAG: hypothetical protein QOJ39_298 [Candidatus Eremiobacteraeota bacterium]|jgi:hypothetical protein|nr:hypothetical protein [Candidatus Eremiobacteraeota bacterium]
MRPRTRTIIIAALAGSLAAVAAPVGSAAQSDVPATLDGHWTCGGPGVPATQRTYFTVPASREGTRLRPREVFAAADRVERDGRPSTSFEHITEQPDHTLTVQSVEGNGTAATAGTDTGPLRFAGRTADDAASFTLTYTIEGGTLHRSATRGGAVIDDERCTREQAAPVPTTCDHPNVPAGVVHAIEPDYPPAAAPALPSGIVYVRVVLDDRSRVLWADVSRSDNAVFDETATLAARDSTYRTAVRNCRSVAAIYIFGVSFAP